MIIFASFFSSVYFSIDIFRNLMLDTQVTEINTHTHRHTVLYIHINCCCAAFQLFPSCSVPHSLFGFKSDYSSEFIYSSLWFSKDFCVCVCLYVSNRSFAHLLCIKRFLLCGTFLRFNMCVCVTWSNQNFNGLFESIEFDEK